MAVISNGSVTSSTTNGVSTAVVTWQTDEAADSTVAYGPGSAPDGSDQAGVVRDSNQVTAHSETVAGLEPGATFWVQVSSADAFGTPLSYDPGFPNGVLSFQTPADVNNGGSQSAAATVSAPTATSATLAWASSDPGFGSVNYWVDGTGTQLNAAESSPTTSHSVALSDLVGATKYDFQFSTAFVDAALPTAVSAQASFSTAADNTPPDPPGRLGVCVSPLRIAVGQTATTKAQVIQRDGKPVAGVPVHFINGGGNLQGTLSQAQAVTDAQGQCSTVFTATSVTGFGRLAFHEVQVVAGTAPHLKARRALVFAVGTKPVGGGHPGPGHR